MKNILFKFTTTIIPIDLVQRNSKKKKKLIKKK